MATTTFTKCIFCLMPLPMTAEHVVPDALGGSWVLYCACKACNSKLGHAVDPKLSENFLARLGRQSLRIPGKRGDIPNALESGTVKLPDGSERAAYYRMKRDGSPDRVEVATRLEKTETDDGRLRLHAIGDAAARNKLLDAVNKTLTRSGLPAITREQFEKELRRGTVPTPEMTIEVSMDANDYVQGLVKIAYEAAAYWLGEEYVANDPLAALLREATFGLDALEGHRGDAAIGFRTEDEGVIPPDHHMHTVALVRHERSAIAAVSILGNTFMCNFVATDDADRYGFVGARIIEMDAQTRTYVESDATADFARIALTPAG